MSSLVLIFGFILALTFVQHRAKERRDRLRVLEEAIRDGNLDPATKEELVSALTGRRPHAPRGPGAVRVARHGVWARAAFVIGWLGLFLGGALVLIGDRDTVAPGIAIAAISFALVTLPIALRELETGKTRAAERR